MFLTRMPPPADIVQEISTCTTHYKTNLCASSPIPAMVHQCAVWESCMNRDPTKIGRAKVSAELIAEVVNGFVDPISWKTLVSAVRQNECDDKTVDGGSWLRALGEVAYARPPDCIAQGITSCPAIAALATHAATSCQESTPACAVALPYEKQTAALRICAELKCKLHPAPARSPLQDNALTRPYQAFTLTSLTFLTLFINTLLSLFRSRLNPAPTGPPPAHAGHTAVTPFPSAPPFIAPYAHAYMTPPPGWGPAWRPEEDAATPARRRRLEDGVAKVR